jgi:hypothetical protein
MGGSATSVFAAACGTTTWNLIAGQTNDVGSVTVENDTSYLYVTYKLDEPGATFGTLHLWVGNDLVNVPSNPQGTPVPGQFPYKPDASGLTEYTFKILLTELGIQDVTKACVPTPLQLYVVAHAEVNIDGEHETAFGGDQTGSGPRWWFYAKYSVCCSTPPVIRICETAFAKGGWVFTTDAKSNPESLPSLRLIKNRWGWAINLSTSSTSYYDIWAGAGLNRTSSGTLVGRLKIVWDGEFATVTYELADGADMKELHVYASPDKPTTVAPGQYGFTQYFDPPVDSFSEVFYLPNDGDGVWVIAHAVTCIQ